MANDEFVRKEQASDAAADASVEKQPQMTEEESSSGLTFGLEDPSLSDKPAKKKMSSLTRGLIALGILLVIVAGAWLAVTNLVPPPEVSQEVSAFPIYECDKNDIKSISISTVGAEYELYPSKSSSGELIWNIRGYDTENLEQDKLNDVVNTLTPLNATEEILQNPTKEQLADYGLEDPLSITKLTLNNGDTFELHVGTMLPDGNGAYGYLPEENTIYAIWHSTATYLTRLIADFWEYPDIDLDTANLANLTITMDGEDFFSMTNLAFEEEVDPDEVNVYDSWLMTVPFRHELNTQRLEEWFSVFSLQYIDDLVMTDATEKDLELYGLVEPSLKVSYGIADSTGAVRQITVRVGRMLDDTYCAILVEEDPTTIYSITYDTFDYVIMKPLDMINRTIIIPQIGSVTEVLFEGPEDQKIHMVYDRTYELDANGKPVVDEQTGNKVVTEEVHYLNGNKNTNLSATKKLYEEILSLEIEGVNFDFTTTEDPVYKLTYMRPNHNRKTIELTFYRLDRDRLMVAIDGQMTPFYIFEDSIERVFGPALDKAMSRISAE